MFFFDQEINHLAYGSARGLAQVIIEAHADVVSGGFGARIAGFKVLAHDELNGAHQRCFDSGDVHLTIALAGMAIADQKKRSRRVDRKIQSAAGNQFLVVHVAGMNPWWRAVEASVCFWWSFADAAKKWMQRNFDAGGEFGYHAFPIQRNDLGPRIRKVVGQKTCARPKAVVGVRNCQLDFLDANFERVARLGALNVDRASEDMPAGTF